MKYRISSTAICSLLVATLLVITACSGPDIGEVSGRVTVNGKPLGNAHILFCNPDKNVSINANLNEDGTYVIKTYQHNGLPPGEYQVAVKSGTFGHEEGALVGETPVATLRPTVPIPPKYNYLKTSGFSATVKSGKNEPFNFDLK